MSRTSRCAVNTAKIWSTVFSFYVKMSTVMRPKKFVKRPDDSGMKKEVDSLMTEIKELEAASNELTAQIDRVKFDARNVERKKQLQAELKDVISEQGSFKAERSAIQTQIKNVDMQVKKKIAEIQKLTSKTNFKSASEIDTRIKNLDELIGSGELRLAEERKLIRDLTSLRKLRKDFGEVESQQSAIDKDKTKIAELKDQLSNIGNKEVQARFESIQKELDEINSSNNSTYEQRNKLISKRNELRKSRNLKYDQIKKLRADFNAEFAKFKEQLAEEQRKRDAEHKAMQEEEKKLQIKEEAKRRLEEASVPAFTEEINEIHGLLLYFDSSYKKPQKNAVAEATKLEFTSESSGRKIEMPEGVEVLKKEQQPFFQGSGGKKQKKKSSKQKNFTVDPDVIVSLSNLSIQLPVKSDDVSTTVNTLKETLQALEEKQGEQTEKNTQRAKEEIAKLETEDAE